MIQEQFSFSFIRRKDAATREELEIEAEVEKLNPTVYTYAGFICKFPRLWLLFSFAGMMGMAVLGGLVGGLDTIDLSNPERGMGARGTALAGRLYALYNHLQLAICHGDVSLNPNGYPSPFVYWEPAFAGGEDYGYCSEDDSRRLTASSPAWEEYHPRADVLFGRAEPDQMETAAAQAHRGVFFPDELVAPAVSDDDVRLDGMSRRELYDGVSGRGSRLDYSSACKTYSSSERLVVVFEDQKKGRTLLRAEALTAMCEIESDIESKYDFQGTCRTYRSLDSDSPASASIGDCCPVRSIAQYMADWSGVECTDLTDDNVAYGLGLLQDCVEWYQNETMFDCMGYEIASACEALPKECNNVTIYDSFNALLPTSSVDAKLKDPVHLLKQEPHNLDTDWLYDIHEGYLYPMYQSRKAKYYSGMRLSSYYTHTKYDVFSSTIVSDLAFAGLAFGFVFTLILLHSESFIFSCLAFTQIMSALGVGFTVYTQILRFAFFPALNLVAVFIVIGIGADDIFVFVDHWNQSFEELPPQSERQLRLAWVFQHAGAAMVITSITTSVAFFANLFSAITAIRLFGLYCGVVVVTDFCLNMTVIPSVMLCFLKRRTMELNDECLKRAKQRYKSKIKEGYAALGSPTLGEDLRQACRRRAGQCVAACQRPQPAGEEQAQERKEKNLPDIVNGGETSPHPKLSTLKSNPKFVSQSLGAGYRRGSVRERIQTAFSDEVHTMQRGFGVWLLVLVAFTAFFMYASSNVEWSSSVRFPVFRSRHPMEVFDQVDRDRFWQDGEDSSFQWSALFLWGLKPIDNGDHFNPDSSGHAVYENAPEISSKAAQQWIWDFCADAEDQEWYMTSTSEHCFIKDLKTWIDFPCANTTDDDGWVDDDGADPDTDWVQYPARTTCCTNTSDSSNVNETTFPWSPDYFQTCLNDFTGTWTNPFNPDLFDLEVAKHLVFYDAAGDVKVLGIEFATNIDYSTTFESAQDFFDEVDKWFNKQIAAAPKGTKLSQGFFTANLWFYAVQEALVTGAWQATLSSVLLAAGVLLFMTSDWRVAGLAALTIFCITFWLTGILVLIGWTLGPVESIIFSVAVGMAVDFVSHISHAYVHVELPDTTPEFFMGHRVFGKADPQDWDPWVKRNYRAMVALQRMGVSVSTAALTTASAGMVMLACTTIFFFQFGTFMVLVMCLSWGFSVTFLVPMLSLFGPAEPKSLEHHVNQARQSVWHTTSILSDGLRDSTFIGEVSAAARRNLQRFQNSGDAGQANTEPEIQRQASSSLRRLSSALFRRVSSMPRSGSGRGGGGGGDVTEQTFELPAMPTHNEQSSTSIKSRVLSEIQEEDEPCHSRSSSFVESTDSVQLELQNTPSTRQVFQTPESDREHGTV